MVDFDAVVRAEAFSNVRGGEIDSEVRPALHVVAPLLDCEASASAAALVLCLRDIRAQDEVVSPVRDKEVSRLCGLGFIADAVVP